MVFDSIIIGGGPAGLTAAIYLGRYELKTLLLTGDIGGQTAIAGKLENYPGIKEINGFELTSKMMDQVKSLDAVEARVGEGVEDVTQRNGNFIVKTGNDEFEAKTILITAGKRHRELGLENEKNLIGKGLSYCATCDGPFARGKKVVIVGGGYAATEAALILEKLADLVTMINIGDALSGEPLTLKKIGEGQTKIINSARVNKILTNDIGMIEGVEYLEEITKSTQTAECEMVFVEIGQIPNTQIFKDFVKISKEGEIEIDTDNKTNIAGVYAAGDITNVKAKQTIVACGEGAKAAISINKYLHSKEG